MGRTVVAVVSLIFGMICFPTVSAHAGGSIGDDQADAVWGQRGMTSNAANGGGISASSLGGPNQVAVDSSGNLWVADIFNNRVLMYPPGSNTATKVLGQSSFTTNGSGVSQTAINWAAGVAIDTNGTLFVSDYQNSRVLVFFHAASLANGAPASLVLGQPNFTSSQLNNPAMVSPDGTTCSATSSGLPNECTLYGPELLSVDPAGDLLVADSFNNRVLLWPAAELSPTLNRYDCTTTCYIPATMVWGQAGSFHTNSANGSHSHAGSTDTCPDNLSNNPTACTLNTPFQAIADPQGDLFIADANNNRVLEIDGALTTGTTTYRQAATMVYGQAGDFTKATANNGGLSASSLSDPNALALDPAGNLWVDDRANNRLLEFPPAVTTNRSSATAAIGVFGQRGQFTSGSTSSGAPSGSGEADAGTLNSPVGFVFDESGNAYVADQANNRVLEYLQPYPISARIGLAAGWNLVALPSATALPYSAASVVNQVDQERGSVSEVAVYGNGRYQVYVPGYASDFVIAPKEGFWVLTTRASTWGVT